jgi:hypothetical protein
MELREQLEQQLQTAPETEVIGVVSASGVGAGSGASPADPWTILISFSGWRQRGGELQQSELTLRMEVPRSKVNRYQEGIRAFEVLRVHVRLAIENAFGSPQALITGTIEKDNGDTELLTYAKQLREPVTVQDPQFGVLTLDRRLNWYESETTTWGRDEIRLTLDAKRAHDLDMSLATARSLWSSQQSWQQKIIGWATTQLLPIKNDSWLNEDEPELTPEEFAQKMVLTSITTRPDGSFDFWFNDGDLFWGHSIMVTGNLKEGPTRAGIEG